MYVFIYVSTGILPVQSLHAPNLAQARYESQVILDVLIRTSR